LCVSPRAPAQHRDDAKEDCERIAADDVHSLRWVKLIIGEFFVA
jgi:hypothetical protein